MILVGEFSSMTSLFEATIGLKFGALSHSWHFSNRRCVVKKNWKLKQKHIESGRCSMDKSIRFGAWLWSKIKHRSRWTSRTL